VKLGPFLIIVDFTDPGPMTPPVSTQYRKSQASTESQDWRNVTTNLALLPGDYELLFSRADYEPKNQVLHLKAGITNRRCRFRGTGCRGSRSVS